MGLVINNNFGFGKLSTLSSMGRGSSNIRAHSSASDGNYLQGAAGTFNILKVWMSVYLYHHVNLMLH